MISFDLTAMTRSKLDMACNAFNRNQSWDRPYGKYGDPCCIGVLIPAHQRRELDQMQGLGLPFLLRDGVVIAPREQHQDAIDMQTAYDGRNWPTVERIAARWMGGK